MKIDGRRVLVEKGRSGAVKATSRHGEPTRLGDAIVDGLGWLPALSALDCELDTRAGVLFPFDVLMIAGRDVAELPLSTRLVRLAAVLEAGESVQAVRTIRDRKDEFYRAVVREGGEGIVLKNLGDPYPRRGVVWLKVKPNV